MRIITITFLTLLLYSNIFAATLYMGADETYTNLQAAMSAMSGGDTLIIRDGTYTGATNVIDHTHYPPSGSDGAYTKVHAESIGGVIFDGGHTRNMFSLDSLEYIEFQGIIWKQTLTSLVIVILCDYIKFFDCAAADVAGTGKEGGDGFIITHSSNVLLERCWSWGNVRKHFYIANSAENVIVRQCVARHDRYTDYADQECFMAYDCWNVEFQNCIAIDGDQGTYYTPEGIFYHAFTTRNGGSNIANGVYYRGCISLNNSSMAGWLGSADVPNQEITNCVHWGGNWGTRLRGSGASINHWTTGSVIQEACTHCTGVYLEADENVMNSLIYDVYYGIYESNESSDYNAIYACIDEYWESGTAIAGTHDISETNGNAIDPIDGTPGNGTVALKYLVRIEDNSNLDGVASDGGDIGATILKKIGTDRTLYGESGYNTTTATDLWPFPNEGTIKSTMAAYEYDDGSGGEPEITGARGFCAVGDITLTSYIWEYLGNQIPDDIYGDNPTTSGTSSISTNGASGIATGGASSIE